MALSARQQDRHHNHEIKLVTHAKGKHEMPIDALPAHGTGIDTAYEWISSELLLDGQARLNLATFVTTWMPKTADVLMGETADKNMIDKDEYPVTAEMESRCVNIIADMWSSPDHEQATGCSTTGSSEACMLGGLALKWRWRERMRAAGKSTDRPNMVMGINVQVCWEKFCRYWDVEPRLVPMEGETFHLTADRAVAHCDENTIGVVAILGSTFDGSYEPVKEIAAALDRLETDKHLNVPMHVDAASGGFVAPFLSPDLEWDFRIPRVQSINASGHKYGLVYPGVGWAIWRDHEALPKDLVFDVNYLGGHMPTFALNFSRPGSEVIAQYFMFMAPRAQGLHGHDAEPAGDRDLHLRRGLRRWVPTGCSPKVMSCRCLRSRSTATSRTTPCSTSPTACASRAGWCPPTPTRRTARSQRPAGRRPRRDAPGDGGQPARVPRRADRGPADALGSVAEHTLGAAPGVRAPRGLRRSTVGGWLGALLGWDWGMSGGEVAAGSLQKRQLRLQSRTARQLLRGRPPPGLPRARRSPGLEARRAHRRPPARIRRRAQSPRSLREPIAASRPVIA